MPAKIRLQRRGRKGYAYYHIIIADSRAPRDGKFIEKIGSYNPNTQPSTVELQFDRAMYWLSVGAQPTDTVRNILSAQGVLLKKHLLEGVKKGAFDEAEAEKRFEAWKADKTNKLNKTKEQIAAEKSALAKERLAAEKAVLKAKADLIAKEAAEAQAAIDAEKAEKAAAKAAEEAAEEAVQEEVVAEAVVEEPAKEAPTNEPVAEEPAKEEATKEEATKETPAEEPANE